MPDFDDVMSELRAVREELRELRSRRPVTAGQAAAQARAALRKGYEQADAERHASTEAGDEA